MQERYGQSHGAVIALHGGAGSWDPKDSAIKSATEALAAIARDCLAALAQSMAPLDVVVQAVKAMELDPRFNAGRGATFQADAQARLTAALMDGPKLTFSGVIAASYMTHPSLLARHLQGESSRVLAPPGTELLARKLGLPVESQATPERVAKWVERAKTGGSFCDTVGCVLRTAAGGLYAGTSTGGRGYEFPGRVSDSATVAGTYCSDWLGVSATGTGEEIVDDAVAARLETRRRDGMSLEDASRRTFAEAVKRKRSYGWITLDRDGAWGATWTTKGMAHVVMSSEQGVVTMS